MTTPSGDAQATEMRLLGMDPAKPTERLLDGIQPAGSRGSGIPYAWWTVALLQGLAGLLALGYSIWPVAPDNPVLLDRWAGTALLALAGATAALSPRLPRWSVTASLVLTAAVLLILVATRSTDAGTMTLFLLLTLLSVIAGLYLSTAQMVLVGVAVVVGFDVAVAVSQVSVNPLLLSTSCAALILLTLLVHRLVDGQRRLLSWLQSQALRDPLTGVFNRRGAELAATAVRSVAERTSHAPTTVVAIDLDDFKRINDRFGHACGDQVLQELTTHWRTHTRAGDVLARLGGDEFLLVLPNTDEVAAGHLLRRMHDGAPCGWSQGTATWPPGQPFSHALRVADQRLYQDKERHRAQRH